MTRTQVGQWAIFDDHFNPYESTYQAWRAIWVSNVDGNRLGLGESVTYRTTHMLAPVVRPIIASWRWCDDILRRLSRRRCTALRFCDDLEDVAEDGVWGEVEYVDEEELNGLWSLADDCLVS